MKKWPNGKPGSPTGPKRTWPSTWSRLADAAGGVDALAGLLCTSRRQLQRWVLHDVTPTGPATALILQTSKSLGVRSPVGESDVESRTGVLFPLEENQTLKSRMSAAVKARAEHVARSARAPKGRAPRKNAPKGKKRAKRPGPS